MNTTSLGPLGPTTISAPDMTPGGAPTGTSAASASLLPDPAGTPLTTLSLSTLAMLLTQADQKDATDARTLQEQADAAAARDDDQHVQELRAKADSDRDAGFYQGAFEIAGGAFTMGSAFVSGPVTNPDGSKSGKDWPTALAGAAKALPGVGQIMAASAKATSDEHDASAARLDANSKADLRHYDEAHGDVQSAQSAEQKVQQWLENAQAAENAARLAAANFRG